MIIRVICIGKSKLSPPEHCTAGQFGAFCNGVAEFPIIKEDVPKMKSRGYDIYIAPGRAAAQTAELFFENAETIEEPQLSSLPLKEDTSTGSGSFCFTSGIHSAPVIKRSRSRWKSC